MTTRRLIALVLAVALVSVVAAPLAVRAQQAAKVRRIGVLTSGFKDAPDVLGLTIPHSILLRADHVIE